MSLRLPQPKQTGDAEESDEGTEEGYRMVEDTVYEGMVEEE
jgi:hypothetical protein